MALSTQFGQEELKIPIAVLSKAILMVQFVAFFGSIVFRYVAKASNAKLALILSLTIWIGTLIYSYGFMYTVTQFFFMAAVVAIVMGGSQALSRSMYSQMIPEGQESEYFSLYEVSSSGTSWLGPLLFGLALQLTNSYRLAILSLLVFFIVGLVLLWFVNPSEAAREAAPV